MNKRTCANGDGRPICPPSRVICRECMDQISRNLRAMIEDRCCKRKSGSGKQCTRDDFHEGECFYG